jgi:hypothetical protein
MVVVLHHSTYGLATVDVYIVLYWSRAVCTWCVMPRMHCQTLRQDSLICHCHQLQLHPCGGPVSSCTYEKRNELLYIRVHIQLHARVLLGSGVWTILLPRDRPASSPAAPGSSHLTD